MNDSTENSSRPIGVFDSGIGGLTVFRELLRQLKGERLLYFGDTARVPYGSKSGDTVTRFTLEAADFLQAQSIKALVVACNTASAYAIPALETRLGIPVLGVIEAGAKAAADASRGGPIGVIGTSATVASPAYESALRRRVPDAKIVTMACPLFVPLVEEGWTDHRITREIAEEYLSPLRQENLDCLILGCTHYPLLKGVIQDVMGPSVKLVDAGNYTARELKQILGPSRGSAAEAKPDNLGHHIFLTDSPPAFRRTSERFLGKDLPPVEVVAREEERWVRA